MQSTQVSHEFLQHLYKIAETPEILKTPKSFKNLPLPPIKSVSLVANHNAATANILMHTH